MGNIQKLLSVSALAFSAAAIAPEPANANMNSLLHPSNPVNTSVQTIYREAAKNRREPTEEEKAAQKAEEIARVRIVLDALANPEISQQQFIEIAMDNKQSGFANMGIYLDSARQALNLQNVTASPQQVDNLIMEMEAQFRKNSGLISSMGGLLAIGVAATALGLGTTYLVMRRP